MTVYKRNSSGEDVVRIQKALKEAGLLEGPLDGMFGAKTEAAVKSFQTRFGLSADGVVGPATWDRLFSRIIITEEHLSAIAGKATPLMPALAEWLNTTCPSYGIDTKGEYAHFLAQACHEADHFKTLREYASGEAYEGRKDLGNTRKGDGPRFKGRGIFQTTGRANYLQLGIARGSRDLFIRNPELLEQPQYAVWSACEYWKTRNLNDIANHADSDVLKKKYRGTIIDVSPVEFISITINGGYNGMEQRKVFYKRAQGVLV